MTERQDPTEQLLDLLVYAPLGLAMEVIDLLPKLATKGRRRMGGKVTVARMVGELAVRQGQNRLEKLVDRMREQQSAARSGPTGPGSRTEADQARPDAPRASHRPEASVTPPARIVRTDGSELAIPGYDTLSASQVIPRLDGLSADELEAVRHFEEAHRARKTVLSRIDQLWGPG